MEDYESLISKFWNARVAEIKKIQSMLDLVIPSFHKQVATKCSSMHSSGTIHSSCTDLQHHDVRWDMDLKISLYEPEFHRGRLVANINAFFDFGHPGMRVTLNFMVGVREALDARTKFYSEEQAKIFFDDLVYNITIMREKLYMRIFEVILEHDENFAYWFGNANAWAEKALELESKFSEARRMICGAKNELNSIAIAILQTKSFAKSKTIAGIRERIEKLANQL